MKNKRAMSMIVSTLIIILLVLVAIGIVWVVVRNLIQGGAEGVEFSQKCLDVEVKATAISCEGDPSVCDVTFERTGTGTDEIAGVKVVFRNSTANSAVISVDGNIELLAGKTEAGIATTLSVPSSIEVTIFFKDDTGNEKICSQTTTKEFTA